MAFVAQPAGDKVWVAAIYRTDNGLLLARSNHLTMQDAQRATERVCAQRGKFRARQAPSTLFGLGCGTEGLDNVDRGLGDDLNPQRHIDAAFVAVEDGDWTRVDRELAEASKDGASSGTIAQLQRQFAQARTGAIRVGGLDAFDTTPCSKGQTRIHLSDNTSYCGTLYVEDRSAYSGERGWGLMWLHPDGRHSMSERHDNFRTKRDAIAFGEREYGVRAKWWRG